MSDQRDHADDLSSENAPDVVYERFLDQGVLAYQRCTGCAKAVFPPRVICPHCGDTGLEWRSSAGSGRVYSVTTLFPRGKDPYHVALIDVAEGFRMMSNVVGTETVAIGAAVGGRVDSVDGAPLPVFALVDEP